MPNTKHFAALDGLRGLAALVVLIGHLELGPYLHPPHFELAVDFFFLLSGFVITHAYENKLRKGLTFISFAEVRLIRLYPLILLGLSIGTVILFARAMMGHDYTFFLPGIVSWMLALFILPSPLLQYTVGEGAFPFNIPSWSLFAELVINAAYALFVHRLTDRMLALTVLVGAVLILIFGIDGGSTWQTIPIGFVRVLFSFAAGIGLYRLFLSGYIRRIRAPFYVIAAALILTFCLPRGEMSRLVDGIAVLIIFPLIVAAGANAKLTGTLEKLALFGGQLSYPLYILHHPLLKPFANVIRVYQLTGIIFWVWTAFEITCILVFAFYAMKFYDEPLRQFISRRLKQKPSREAQRSPLL
jgi:peptidoglycan/LPS O-acetylase OafA/YrhL